MSKYGHKPHNWFEAIVNKMGGEERADAYLRDELVLQSVIPLSDSFDIEVDYNQTLDQMIAAGRYDWKNSDITAKRFPIKGEGKVSRKAHLIHFNRNISSDDALNELDKQGKRPATIDELLAFGAKYPEIQRKFPVVALGSSTEIRGDREVAYLDRRDSRRCLYLYWWGVGWGAGYRFLASDK